MTAIEISKATKTKLYAKPVFSQGVMQKALHELTGELDVVANGVTLRLPVGTTIALTAGGSGGMLGSLMTDVDFVALNGQTYRANQGTQIRVPA